MTYNLIIIIVIYKVTFPVDLVKTRLQIQGQLIESIKPKYKGIFNCFNLVVKEEGVRALYGG